MFSEAIAYVRQPAAHMTEATTSAADWTDDRVIGDEESRNGDRHGVERSQQSREPDGEVQLIDDQNRHCEQWGGDQ